MGGFFHAQNQLHIFVSRRQRQKERNLWKLIVLPKGKTKIILFAEETFYFEYCVGGRIKIVTVSGEEHIYLTLAEIFKQVDVFDFAFCHKGCIVNLEYVKRIKGLAVELSNGAILPIAQKRASAFRETHHEFLQRRVL